MKSKILKLSFLFLILITGYFIMFAKVETRVLAEENQTKPDLVIENIYYENGLVKVKYCNEGGVAGADSDLKVFYIKVATNAVTHDGTSGGSNYPFSVPAPGEC